MKTSLTIILFCLQVSIYCQDAHFTQIDQNYNYINPSLCGNYPLLYQPYKYKLSFINRLQWRSISSPFIKKKVPFTTIQASIDGIFKNAKILNRDFIHIGFTAYKDQAGDLNLGTTKLSLNTSYNKRINYSGTKFISFGIQSSVCQTNLNLDQDYYDSQWTGKEFNPNLPNNEPRLYNSKTYIDLSSGISFINNNYDFIFYKIGYSVFHLNAPSITIYNNNSILSMRHSFTTDVNIPMRNFMLRPCLIFNAQNKSRELLTTVYLHKNTLSYNQIQIGLGTRITGKYNYNTTSDALVLLMNLLGPKYSIQCSYDFNVSILRRASNVKGAMEVCLNYYFGNNPIIKPSHRKFKKKQTECPKDQRLD